MKIKIFLLALLVTGAYSCSSDEGFDDNSGLQSQANLTFNVTGMPEIKLENVGGKVDGSNYEAGNMESAQIIATNNSNDLTVTINLVDNDINSQAIQPGNTISIDNSQSTDVFATFIIDGTTIFEAISGTISISLYDLLSPNSDIIVISGSFSASDGTNTANGTFSNIELMCSECGG